MIKKKLYLVLLIFVLLVSSVLADAPIGFNTDFIVDGSSQVVFVDVMKQSRDWVDQNWAPAGALQRRADGYPTEVPQGSITMVRTLFATGGDTQPFPHLSNNPTPSSELIYPAGDYTVLYDGDGDLQFSGSAQIVSPCVNNQCIINTNGGGIITITRSDVNDPIRNIRVLMPGYSAAQADEFYPPFINKLGGTSTIRFMNVMNTNRPLAGSLTETNVTWSGRTKVNHNTQNTRTGMAVEYLVEISNQAGKSPWFTISHLADDDYVRNFASYVANNLDPSLDVYVEFSNELWNNIFGQANYARNEACNPSSQAFVPFPGGGIDWGIQGCDDEIAAGRWQGLKSGRIFNIFQQEFAAAGVDVNKIIRVAASQSGSLGWERFRFNPIFDGLVMEGQTADGIAIAPYFGGGVPGTFGSLDQIQATSVDQLLDMVDQDIDTGTLSTIQGGIQYAQEKGVRLFAYEGGHHLTAAGASVQLTSSQRCDLLVYQRTLDFCGGASVLCTDPCATGYGLICDATQTSCWDPTWQDANGNYFTSGENVLPFFPAKLIAATHHPRMQGMYERYLDMWFNNGGDIFNIYKYANEPSKWGSWGTLDYLTQPLSEAPMYAGVMSSVTKWDGHVPGTPPGAVCGNSIVDAGEVCDGNTQSCTVSGYSGSQNCNAQCSGYDVCTTTESCGDGIVNGPEVCDDGANNGQPGFCNLQCDGIVPTTSVCGDGVLEVGEQCDDGNQVDGDGCSSACLLEQTSSPNLRLHWTFDPDTTDQTGNGFNGISTGSTVDCTVAGETGQGCLVSNQGDFLYAGFPLQLSEPNGFAAASWINFDTVGEKILTAVGHDFQISYFNNNVLRCHLVDAPGTYNHASEYSFVPQVGQWYHVACSFDPADNSLRLYRDGVEVSMSTVSFSSFPSYNVNRWMGLSCDNIWWCPAGSNFGEIRYDDVRVYNNALTASEVSTLHSGGTNTVCGNGVVEAGEVCDGGSQLCLINGYSGSQNCNTQCTGYDLCTSLEYCGDGIVNGPEICDSNTQSCTTAGGYSGSQACAAQCDTFNTCTSPDFCGDAVINGLETCDDGSLNGQPNFCDAQCTGITPAICGNNVLEEGEICDGDNQICSTSGYSGSQDCTAQCDGYNICTTNDFCGDAVTNGPETCDDGSLNGQPNLCNAQCTGITTPVCGNSVVESGEICDGNTQSCTVNGYLGTETCNVQCNSFNTCTTTDYCGDSIINGLEVCDDGAVNSHPGSCNLICTGALSSTCGNGVQDVGEICW